MSNSSMANMANANGLVRGKKQGVALVNKRYQPLYNMKTLAVLTAASAELIFTDVSSSSVVDTNLKQQAFLPSPQFFDVYGLSLQLQYGSAIADINAFFNSSAVVITIQDKEYFKLPCNQLPTMGLNGFAATTVAATTILGFVNGTGEPGAMFPLHRMGRPIRLKTNEAPTIKIVTGSITTTATMKIWLMLHGILYAGVN